LLLAGTALALAWLPRRPEIALAVSAAATAALFTLGYAYAFWPAPALIAVFATISTGRRAIGWAGAAFLVAVPAVAAALHPGLDNAVAVVIWALLVLVIAQPAEVSRARRAYTREVERRAAEAERTREEEALRRAQEERLRVTREVHDVTSHTLSVIALHAAVAAEAVDRAGGPPEARDALTVIRDSTRQALGEMKNVLGVLRPGPRHPLPGTAQLPDLIRHGGRSHRRRGGRRRGAGGDEGGPAGARRGADGHPDARRRRPGGDPPHHLRPDPRRRGDHVRPGRVRVRGAAFGRQRIPRQGRRTGRDPPRRPGGR